MKQSKRISIAVKALQIMSLTALFFFPIPMSTALGAEHGERSSFGERQFRERLRSLERSQDGAEQARLVTLLLQEARFSSLQVKAMAKVLTHEGARYDFALAAYPRTVDPDNFYEVYDAFTSFSKVLRLHDQIQQLRATNGPLGRPASPSVSDEAMADIIKSIRAEGLDDGKKALARQIFTGQRRFLSRQVTEVLKAIVFDDTRLEIAKLAYDVVIDPENYFLVNGAFAFPSTKESLARYIESRREERPRPRGR